MARHRRLSSCPGPYDGHFCGWDDTHGHIALYPQSGVVILPKPRWQRKSR
jgi:hypothetical protein